MLLPSVISFPPCTSNYPVIPLLQRCKSMDQFLQIHALAVKTVQDRHALVLFKLLRLSSSLCSLEYATQIFDAIRCPDVYHYTALIAAHISLTSHRDALRLYSQMVSERVHPDTVAISYVLKACASSSSLPEGRQLHCQALKLGLARERPVRMKLMELYGRCVQFEDAKQVFGEMPERDAVASTILISTLCDHGLVGEALVVFEGVRDKDTVCWTAMIDGCARNGRANVALELFRDMQRACIGPNELTLVCVLSACSQLGALQLGRWVHSYVGKHGMDSNAFTGNALIEMYSNSGSLEEAIQVFEEMTEKDVVSYNSMIAGLAMHGKCNDSVELYRQMIACGIQPTEITFVGVLNACSHGGIVDIGFEIFESMTKDYGLEPRIEHYGCMVDLLARAGHLLEAYEFAKEMSIESDHIIWGTLLSACKIHGNLKLGEKVAKILINKEADDSGTFVLLSNVYSSFGEWEEAAMIRMKMKGKGIHKEPGCSSIEVDNKIHEFLLGDIRHPRREEIYKKLEELNDVLKGEGYVPDKDVVRQTR